MSSPEDDPGRPARTLRDADIVSSRRPVQTSIAARALARAIERSRRRPVPLELPAQDERTHPDFACAAE